MANNSQIEECLIELRLISSSGSIDPDESLFDRGIIDSLAIASVVTALSSKFGIIVRDEDLLPDNFHSISAMANYVNHRSESVD